MTYVDMKYEVQMPFDIVWALSVSLIIIEVITVFFAIVNILAMRSRNNMNRYKKAKSNGLIR